MQKYCLVAPQRDTYDIINKETKYYNEKLCLACQKPLVVNIFCMNCKSQYPLNWTSDDVHLDSFILESQSQTMHHYDNYLLWIKYSELRNMEKVAQLENSCTHIADWPDVRLYDKPVRKIMLKEVRHMLSNKPNDGLFNYYEVRLQFVVISTYFLY